MRWLSCTRLWQDHNSRLPSANTSMNLLALTSCIPILCLSIQTFIYTELGRDWPLMDSSLAGRAMITSHVGKFLHLYLVWFGFTGMKNFCTTLWHNFPLPKNNSFQSRMKAISIHVSYGMPSISEGWCIPSTCAAPSIGADQATLLSINCSTCGRNLVSARVRSSTVPVRRIVIPGKRAPRRYIRDPHVLQK